MTTRLDVPASNALGNRQVCWSRHLRVSSLVFGGIFSLTACLGLRAQTIQVTPNRVMVDQPASIQVTGLQSNERVAIRAELVDGADDHWTS